MTTPEGQGCAVLQPVVAEAARRTGAGSVGLVDVAGGRPGTELNLHLDRVRTTYDDGHSLGGSDAGVRLTCRTVGGRPVPATTLPDVVARVAVPVTDDLGARLPQALDEVPDEALAVVLTTWSLSRLAPGRRAGFLRVLEDAATTTRRPVVWVFAEGVGVAPAVPTLGDRPASGHSLAGLARVGDGDGPQVLARCWSRGAVLAWLDPPAPGAEV